MGIFYTTPTKDSTGPAYTASFSVKRKPQGAGQGLCPAGTQEIRLGRANKRVFNLVYVLAATQRASPFWKHQKAIQLLEALFFGSLALEDKTGVKQSSVNPLEEADSCSCGAELLQGQIDKATVPLCAVPAKLLELASSKARDLKESRVHSIAAASNQPQTPLLTPILRQASLNTSAFMQPECPLPQAVYMDASVTQAAAGLLDKTKLNEALSSTGDLMCTQIPSQQTSPAKALPPPFLPPLDLSKVVSHCYEQHGWPQKPLHLTATAGGPRPAKQRRTICQRLKKKAREGFAAIAACVSIMCLTPTASGLCEIYPLDAPATHNAPRKGKGSRPPSRRRPQQSRDSGTASGICRDASKR